MEMHKARIGEGRLFRLGLIGFVLVVALVLIVAPLGMIFAAAFSQGFAYFAETIRQADTLHAIGLTVATALIAVPLNTAFGVAAAWAVTKFDFPGRRALIVLIEIPFSISPIVAGISYLFVYGLQGMFGSYLMDANLQILFALPGIVLASMFVTAPFVARELIPLMQAQGRDLEEAAVSLGAGGLRTFLRVTLPNIRWALLYGVVVLSGNDACVVLAEGVSGGEEVGFAVFAQRERGRCLGDCEQRCLPVTEERGLSPCWEQVELLLRHTQLPGLPGVEV